MLTILILLTTLQYTHATFVTPSFIASKTNPRTQVNVVQVNAVDDITSTTNTPEEHPYDALLPLDFPHRSDALAGIEAIRRACSITDHLQDTSYSTDVKHDSSPVTVADYAAQASVLADLHAQFPTDVYIAEETTKDLSSNRDLLEEVMYAVHLVHPSWSTEDVLQGIDLGQSHRNGSGGRTWCLDPVDGTRGFLRGKEAGGQYCVALALIENGVPTVGILGCPNLPISRKENYGEEYHEDSGCIFVASLGGGCYQLPLGLNGEVDLLQAVKVEVTKSDGSEVALEDARFCIGVEKYSDPLGQCNAMSSILHGANAMCSEGEIVKAVRMDSQVKYGVVARGDGEVYLRLPKPGYVEWIWDHAPGSVIVTEAGGQITDVNGNEIDFSLGAKLSENVQGIIATNGGKFHKAVLDAYHQQALDRKKNKSL